MAAGTSPREGKCAVHLQYLQKIRFTVDGHLKRLFEILLTRICLQRPRATLPRSACLLQKRKQEIIKNHAHSGPGKKVLWHI